MRSQRYGVNAVNLGVRIERKTRDLLYARVPVGERGRWVDEAIRARLRSESARERALRTLIPGGDPVSAE